MTNTTQIQNMNGFIEAFITEHGSEEMVAMWQSEEIQSEFMQLAKKCNTKKTGKKDPNMPKRGKSAYIFFCAENRPKVKTTLGDETTAPDVTAELGRLWSDLKESTKSSDKKKLAQYEEQAKADKERYLTEMADYEPPSEEDLEEKPKGRGRGKKASGKKDPNMPKRGKSTYIFFCADHRAAVKTNLGDEAKNTEILAELGRLWRDLKESTKSSDKKKLVQYEEQAKADKERYLTEMADYDPPSEEDLEEKPKGRGRGKKASGKKDPNMPKRGKSAYIFFCAENRPKVKTNLGDEAKNTEILAELGRLWCDLKESTKSSDKKKLVQYEEQAKADKERYLTEMEEYEPKSDEETTVQDSSDSEQGSDIQDDVPKSPKEEESEKKEEEEREKKEEEEREKKEEEEREKKEEEEREKEKEKKAKKEKSPKKSSEKKTTGYSLFQKEFREDVKEENPDLKPGEITKLLAGMWKDLDKEEQQEWKDRAASC